MTLDGGLPCLKYFESIARIRDAAFKFVSLRPKSHLIAPYRNGRKIFFARANAF